jgi:copper transport protein
MRRQLALVALLAAVAGEPAVHAHAALVLSDPLDRVALGDTPATIRLSFSERPDATLSEIRVLDATGADHHVGGPLPTGDDPLTLFVNVRPLDRGVYTVSWRTVSAVDGHASEGSYVFGVRVEPTSMPAASATNASASALEGLARWILILGFVGLLGGAAASVARFGAASDLTIAGSGCVLAGAGLILLAFVQARNAHVPLSRVMTTDVGRALVWRAVALGVAAVALLVARYRNASDESRRPMMAIALASALTAVAVHVASGHAAASQRWAVAEIASQWAHFGAAGVWFGGLFALLLAVRGQPSAWKSDATRRFSQFATIALVVVIVTGVVRTIGELSSWRDLVATPYGLTILAKIAFTIAIIAFAAANHWRNVAASSTSLSPLRRAGGGELVLAGCTLAAAGLLGAMPPPVALREATGLVASGSDFGTTVRVSLTTPSNQPGPNRFVVHAVDYDSGTTAAARRVSLRFTPVDDPDISSTVLDLTRAPDGSFTGSGANIAFGGRWRITALIERAGDSVEVPMVVETAAPQQFLAIARPPGQAATYRIQLIGTGHVWISPDPERAGRSKVTLTFWDLIQDPQPIDDVVVTVASSNEPSREQPVKRYDRSSFVADINFEIGTNRLTVVARAAGGKRLRAVLNLEIPR